MTTSRAGQPADENDLVSLPDLLDDYHDIVPDPTEPTQRVSFGTSGHRGSSSTASFNEAHIAAITAAIIDYRRSQGYTGPVYLARDTHALSEPALLTAIEVLAAAEVPTMIDERDGYTPTPVLSHAVIKHNAARGSAQGLADGIVITPSHNPPSDGGFKYNPPHGGPAESAVTSWIENRANELLEAGWEKIARKPFQRAFHLDETMNFDFASSYIDDLAQVIDIAAIHDSGLHIGADPMGGASADYWPLIAERLDLNLDVVNPEVDPTFAFMTLDWDEKIRMDCSSQYAMASLIGNRSRFDIATGNDADADRHGIVTPDAGLMNPNHFLAAAVDYLLTHRPDWPAQAKIGRTAVTSALIDRIAAARGRTVHEVPVGFKHFVAGLQDGSLAFGGEESAGASLLGFDGSVWTTDKDGMVMCLLAAEITAVTGRTPSQLYDALADQHGHSAYARFEAPATRAQKAALKQLSPSAVTADTLAGEPITAALTTAAGDGEALGGLKVTTESAWFAARPSGTEDVYKIYAESFRGPEHLAEVQAEAKTVVDAALAGA